MSTAKLMLIRMVVLGMCSDCLCLPEFIALTL